MNPLLEALGTVGDVLDMPGSYARGLLAGRPGKRVGGRELLEGYGLVEEGSGFGGDVAGFLTGVATDPLTWAGLGLGRLGARAATGAAGAASRASGASPLAALRQNRAGFQMVHGVTPEGNIGSVVGMGGARANIPGWTQAADGVAKNADVAFGSYNPGLRAGGALAGEPAALRHETIHGIIDQAGRSGNFQELPLLMRLPAQLRQGLPEGAGGLRAGLADITDELAAQTLQNRGLLNQLGGAANFMLETPWNMARRGQYQQVFSETSPLAAALYRGAGYAPYAAGAAAGTAALATE